MKGLTKTKRFITDNKLDFTGSGSELNSNCTVLAGFICYICEWVDEVDDLGYDIINSLDYSFDVKNELQHVFTYAWYNKYEDFWNTAEAKEKYIF